MYGFGRGLRYLARGFGFFRVRPGVMLSGMVPAAITVVLLVIALFMLAVTITDISGWLTQFAAEWDTAWRNALQVVIGIVVFGLAVWLSVVLFTAITLVIGDPFYDKISAQVDEVYGAPTTADVGFWVSIARSIDQGLRLLLKSILAGIVLFGVALVPIIGSIIAPVLGALSAGWFLSIDLVNYAFERRGIRYRQYRHLLTRHRSTAIGLGTPVFVLFLIPLAAIVVMPAAVAGATLLVREILGESTVLRPRSSPPGP